MKKRPRMFSSSRVQHKSTSDIRIYGIRTGIQMIIVTQIKLTMLIFNLYSLLQVTEIALSLLGQIIEKCGAYNNKVSNSPSLFSSFTLVLKFLTMV
jgi:hypothetical protein